EAPPTDHSTEPDDEGAFRPLRPVHRFDRLLRRHLHPHAHAVAGVIVHAAGVAVAAVFVGRVVGVRAAAAVTVVAIIVAATPHRLVSADLHRGGVTLLPALVVDLAAGDAADHRTDRGRGEAAAAAADLAARHRADDAAGHGRHRTAGGIAAVAAVVVAAARRVIAVAPVAVVAAGGGGFAATPVAVTGRGAAVAVQHRIDPDHPRVVVIATAVARVAWVGVAILAAVAIVVLAIVAAVGRLRGGAGGGGCQTEGQQGGGKSLHGRSPSPEGKIAGAGPRCGGRVDAWLNAAARARAV